MASKTQVISEAASVSCSSGENHLWDRAALCGALSVKMRSEAIGAEPTTLIELALSEAGCGGR